MIADRYCFDTGLWAGLNTTRATNIQTAVCVLLLLLFLFRLTAVCCKARLEKGPQSGVQLYERLAFLGMNAPGLWYRGDGPMGASNGPMHNGNLVPLAQQYFHFFITKFDIIVLTMIF